MKEKKIYNAKRAKNAQRATTTNTLIKKKNKERKKATLHTQKFCRRQYYIACKIRESRKKSAARINPETFLIGNNKLSAAVTTLAKSRLATYPCLTGKKNARKYSERVERERKMLYRTVLYFCPQSILY